MMSVDTSTETVHALIADLRPWNELEGRAADTLAALLDERDALRNANASTVAKWSLDIGRAERAEAERDKLAEQLMAHQSTSDYEMGQINASAVAAKFKTERDRLAAQLRVIEDLVKDTDGDWLHGDSFDGFAGEIQGVLLGTSPWLPRTILADTNEPNGDER